MSDSKHTTMSQRDQGNYWSVEVRVVNAFPVVMSVIVAGITALFKKKVPLVPKYVFCRDSCVAEDHCIFYM